MFAGSSWAVRIPVLAFFFFSLIVTASYTANLASLFTVQLLTPRMNNIQVSQRS
jgi:hypothetical protein